MESQLQQLQKAKDLAMDNSPEQMLPKVLETTNSMLLNQWKTNNNDNNNNLSNFFTNLLLDTMNHNKISNHEKPLIASQYLSTLYSCYEYSINDLHYQQLTILTFTKIYPMLFDLIAKTSDESKWSLLQQFRKKILSQWKLMTITNSPLDLNLDNKQIGLKLSIIKFISQIIITHTVDLTNSSINISVVPENQPLINRNKLETEARILLDVIINYLIEEPMMVSSLFIGIINCLSFIMKQRNQTTMKILNGILKFNIDAKYQNDQMDTLTYKLCKRFVERCYRNFVQFGIKNNLIKNPNNSSNPNWNQIYPKLSKISQTLFVIGEETKNKGILNFDSESVSKRIPDSEREKIIMVRTQKRQQSQQSQQTQNMLVLNNDNNNGSGTINPNNSNPNNVDNFLTTEQMNALTKLQEYSRGKTPSASFFNTTPKAYDNTYNSLFALMDNNGSKQDLSKVPSNVLIKLSTEALYKADTRKIIAALSIAASRYTDLMNRNDPSIGDKRQLEDDNSGNNNNSNSNSSSEAKRIKTDLKEDKGLNNNSTLVKQETSEAVLDGEDEGKEDEDQDVQMIVEKPYFFEPKPMDNDTKMKITERIVKRLFSIKTSKISPHINSIPMSKNPLEQIKLLNWSNDESWYHILIRLATRGTRSNLQMSNFIREELLRYVMMDINDSHRTAIIIEWMNEEWHGDLLFESREDTESQYMCWSLRLLDELIPFLENKHRKLFIRLMSELPKLRSEHLARVKPILIDPSRSTLGFQTLKFLIMFRLPVKAMIKPLLETILKEDPTVEPQCKPILDKFYKD
ncbi:RNA-processing protein PTA1 PWA37_002211 [Arxiozyma heterogenica]|uniref:RNA-processing protein PTA1 n=1 Tax=Arxiozyma heterogenica TaxID=278026 RepID=UPI002EF6A3E3